MPIDSLWPPAAAVRDTALLLVGLVLVVLLADGELVLWLSAVLVIAWALLSFRGELRDDSPEPPMWARLLPVFVAIVVADLIVGDKWFPIALVAIAAPLVALTRAGLVLHRRRSA
jgi:hypothetical protein